MSQVFYCQEVHGVICRHEDFTMFSFLKTISKHIKLAQFARFLYLHKYSFNLVAYFSEVAFYVSETFPQFSGGLDSF